MPCARLVYYRRYAMRAAFVHVLCVGHTCGMGVLCVEGAAFVGVCRVLCVEDTPGHSPWNNRWCRLQSRQYIFYK